MLCLECKRGRSWWCCSRLWNLDRSFSQMFRNTPVVIFSRWFPSLRLLRLKSNRSELGLLDINLIVMMVWSYKHNRFEWFGLFRLKEIHVMLHIRCQRTLFSGVLFLPSCLSTLLIKRITRGIRVKFDNNFHSSLPWECICLRVF